MTKFNRRKNVCISRVGMALLGACALACGPQTAGGPGIQGERACAAVESLLSTSGLPRPSTMRGRATFDIEEYRVRGHFELRLEPAGDATLEFSGATLLGGHREDVVVSLVTDTLRVFDRERGELYENEQVREMVRGSTRTDGDWGLALGRILQSAISHAGIREVRLDGDAMAGVAADGVFKIRIEGGRVAGAVWPDPAPGETFRDRLEVQYGWKGNDLRLIEALLPTRGWRVRLEAD